MQRAAYTSKQSCAWVSRGGECAPQSKRKELCTSDWDACGLPLFLCSVISFQFSQNPRLQVVAKREREILELLMVFFDILSLPSCSWTRSVPRVLLSSHLVGLSKGWDSVQQPYINNATTCTQRSFQSYNTLRLLSSSSLAHIHNGLTWGPPYSRCNTPIGWMDPCFLQPTYKWSWTSSFPESAGVCLT